MNNLLFNFFAREKDSILMSKSSSFIENVNNTYKR